MSGKRDPEMQVFWASLPPKLKTALWDQDRRLVLSSDEVPLQMVQQSRLKTTPKFFLFTDIFVLAQGVTVTAYPLYSVWLEHMPADGMFHSVQNMYSFKLVFPESEMELQCKELAHKSKWVGSIVDTLGLALNVPQFVGARGDQNLDTKLELLRSREYLEHTFKNLAEYREGTYKGQWKNGKPYGSGEFKQESTGRMYAGGFKEGRFHGDGEMHWFSDKDTRKKYIGEFRNGKLDGHGEMKYSNGDVYSGRWAQGVRSGFGRLEETSRKASHYTGAWDGDKRNGYGIHEDKMKHERYLGMWADDVRCGPGMFVSSAGTYCEATFGNGVIASGNDGFVIDPNGRCFMGRLGPDLKLCGKGVLTLTNGTVIEGSFGGSWNKKIEISKATLEDKELLADSTDSVSAVMSELQIANLDSRIGNSTVQAFNKWKPIFKECEAALGFSGDATNDVFSAWNKLASDSFMNRRPPGGGGGGGGGRDKNAKQDARPRRANSLTGMHGRTVRLPVRLIPLERARALTSAGLIRDEALRASFKMAERSRTFASNSDPTSVSSPTETEQRLQISRPINLDESISCSYPSGHSYRVSLSPYAPQADPSIHRHSDMNDTSDLEETVHISDPNATIQEYVDKAFNTPSHPLGILMNRLEAVFHESYGGVGTNKYLLPHAIAEMHSIIKRLHSIVRILFPFWSGQDVNVSQFGFAKLEGFSDPDDYLSIETGYELLHSLVFIRLFSTLITLYVLHHEDSDKEYLKGLNALKDMDETKLVHFIRFPSHVCRKIIGREADGTILKVLDEASNTLRVINSIFTPGEFLEHFKAAFKQLNSIEQLSGDFLLPCVVFILVRANVPHLGAYLHFLTDFANTKAEDDYTLVTYEAAYNFIRRNASSPPVL